MRKNCFSKMTRRHSFGLGFSSENSFLRFFAWSELLASIDLLSIDIQCLLIFNAAYCLRYSFSCVSIWNGYVFLLHQYWIRLHSIVFRVRIEEAKMTNHFNAAHAFIFIYIFTWIKVLSIILPCLLRASALLHHNNKNILCFNEIYVWVAKCFYRMVDENKTKCMQATLKTFT